LPGALSGIRVIDFTHVPAGPFCTALLKELGARVIRVEFGESGDVVSTMPAITSGVEGELYMTVNQGKRSVTLDLKTREARHVALDLIAESDILIEDFQPGVMKILGLDYRAARKVNPKLIYCSLTGFGEREYRGKLPVFDTAAQAVHGPLSFISLPAGPGSCFAVADMGGGPYTVAVMLNALNRRDRAGVGQHIDISLPGHRREVTGDVPGDRVGRRAELPQKEAS
jgi:CoA:oxalate CoA-transferase